jgi:hypothetical protein
MNISNSLVNLEFGHATSFSEPIFVKMEMPDGSKKVIGHVLQDWTNDDAPVLYVSIGSDGEEICPPTDDWTGVESAYLRYAKRYEEKEREAKQAEFASRVNQISKIRQTKGREPMTINK